jgi:hypothetical protein
MMREASRAGGAAFCPEFCAKTKTDNPAKTQSDKISVEKQRIAFLGRARQRLVSEHLIVRKTRCKLNSNGHQLWGLFLDDSTCFAASRGRGRKVA